MQMIFCAGVRSDLAGCNPTRYTPVCSSAKVTMPSYLPPSSRSLVDDFSRALPHSSGGHAGFSGEDTCPTIDHRVHFLFLLLLLQIATTGLSLCGPLRSEKLSTLVFFNAKLSTLKSCCKIIDAL